MYNISVAVEFRWIQWNVEHISEHGISVPEAEYVVSRPARGYPRQSGDERWLVRGRTRDGRYIQVAYLIRSPQGKKEAFVIHARPLTDRERHNLRTR